MQPELKIQFPFVKSFSDYHGGGCFADDLSTIFKPKIKFYEFGFNGDYYFVFYVGNKPKKNEIIEAMKRQKFSDEFIEEIEMRWDS